MAVLTATALTGITTRMADAAMSAGSILQVVTGTYSSISSTTSTSWTDVHSDLSLDITTTGSNKVLVIGQLAGACPGNAYASVFRDSTNLITATGSSNRIPAVADYQDFDDEGWATVFGNIMIVDSPSAGTYTYKWRFYARSGDTFTINRAQEGTDAVYRVHPNSTLTVMEVAV
jgi:hypothetical protein